MKKYLVCGLGFGDEGKGTITEYVVRKYDCDLVVRYNGGAQAAHTVVLEDGRHHTFSQFGCGTLAGAKTFLSQYMLVNPLTLANEGMRLVENFPEMFDAKYPSAIGNVFASLVLDPRAKITTPYHMRANRIRETQRNQRHGSCGMGIGETMEDSLKRGLLLSVNDVFGPRKVAEEILENIVDEKLERFGYAFCDATHGEWWAPSDLLDAYKQVFELGMKFDLSWERHAEKNVVFEGSQGALLDEDYGFPPHQTYSTTIPWNAYAMVGANLFERKIGVLRSYHTRHGAGPFPTEWAHSVHEEHNGFGHYQGAFRTGTFDIPLARYALAASGVTEVALTHLDNHPSIVGMAYDVPEDCEPFVYRRETTRERQTKLGETLARAKPKYANLGAESSTFVGTLSRILDVPIRITSHGPAYNHKAER